MEWKLLLENVISISSLLPPALYEKNNMQLILKDASH